MSTPQQELSQPCAWSEGEPYAGKSYILQTTEGTEIVSEPAFRLSATVARDLRDDQEEFAHDIRAQLARLERRVLQLEDAATQADPEGPGEGDNATPPAPKPDPEAKPAAKTPAKK